MVEKKGKKYPCLPDYRVDGMGFHLELSSGGTLNFHQSFVVFVHYICLHDLPACHHSVFQHDVWRCHHIYHTVLLVTCHCRTS